MDWKTLLSAERYFTPSGIRAASPPTDHPDSQVSVFKEDAERIIYSSAFRRLQGKTQVHPFPSSDYMRTRLTHTIEVANAGRAIAEGVANIMNERDRSNLNVQDFGDIVYAACLAHDLGNPPFGHIGEHAIQTWFKRQRGTSKVISNLLDDPDKANDFLLFDGNAQGFRIITRNSGWRSKGGLQLSHATLGVFGKYPQSSKYASEGKPKFGYMAHDKEAADAVASKLGLIKRGEGKWCRHPLAFVVEAADDICYLTTDIEDACRAELIEFESAESLLKVVGDRTNHLGRYQLVTGQNDKLAYLRAGAVSALIDEAGRAFYENRNQLLDGSYEYNLLERSSFGPQVEAIRTECKLNVYRNIEKMRTEAAGYNIISSLMDMFGGMVDQLCEVGDANKLDKRNEGFLYLLPRETQQQLNPGSSYISFLSIVDYISGMTDRYALDLFQKLTGSSATLGRMT